MRTFSGIKFNEQFKGIHKEGCNGIILSWVQIREKMNIYPFFCVCKLGRKALRIANKTGLLAPLDTHKNIQKIND